jgi:hypothetical protein
MERAGMHPIFQIGLLAREVKYKNSCPRSEPFSSTLHSSSGEIPIDTQFDSSIASPSSPRTGVGANMTEQLARRHAPA